MNIDGGGIVPQMASEISKLKAEVETLTEQIRAYEGYFSKIADSVSGDASDVPDGCGYDKTIAGKVESAVDDLKTQLRRGQKDIAHQKVIKRWMQENARLRDEVEQLKDLLRRISPRIEDRLLWEEVSVAGFGTVLKDANQGG